MMSGNAADYERVKRAFGAEEMERAAEDAKQREAAEKEQRKARRKFSRGHGNGNQEGAPRSGPPDLYLPAGAFAVIMQTINSGLSGVSI